MRGMLDVVLCPKEIHRWNSKGVAQEAYLRHLLVAMSLSSKKQAEGNIQTFLRIRPSKKASGFFLEDDMNPGSLKVTLPESVKNDFVNNSKLHHAYHFNGILSMTASQEDVFKTVGIPAVQNALDGFNSTIFAYGQVSVTPKIITDMI